MSEKQLPGLPGCPNCATYLAENERLKQHSTENAVTWTREVDKLKVKLAAKDKVVEAARRAAKYCPPHIEIINLRTALDAHDKGEK